MKDLEKSLKKIGLSNFECKKLNEIDLQEVNRRIKKAIAKLNKSINPFEPHPY